MNTKPFLLTLMLIFVATANAAKRISSISHTGNETNELMGISYDAKGRIDAVTIYENNAVIKTYAFSYNGADEITVYQTYHDWKGKEFQDIEQFTLEDRKAVVRTKYMAEDDISIRNEFSYENGFMTRCVVYLDNEQKTIMEGQWSGGNMIGSSLNSTTTISYQPSTIQPTNDAVYWLFSIMGAVDNPYLEYMSTGVLLGVYGTPATHMISSFTMTRGSSQRNVSFDYTVDTDGCITAVTMLDDSGTDEDYGGGVEADYYKISWEDNPSGISDIMSDGSGASGRTYSLSGLRIPDTTHSGSSVLKGIYIKGGRKVVVK